MESCGVRDLGLKDTAAPPAHYPRSLPLLITPIHYPRWAPNLTCRPAALFSSAILSLLPARVQPLYDLNLKLLEDAHLVRT